MMRKERSRKVAALISMIDVCIHTEQRCVANREHGGQIHLQVRNLKEVKEGKANR